MTDFELSFGPASDMAAEVVLRTSGDGKPDADLQACIRGPFNSRGRTLPARFPLRRTQETRQWQATIVDPCFWSPQSPNTYQLEITSGAQADREPISFGIRRLARLRRYLRLEGRRWVLRGAWQSTAIDTDLSAWRESWMTMLLPEPDPRLCQAAMVEGVLLVVTLDAVKAAAQLAHIAHLGSVAFGLFDRPPECDLPALKQQFPHLVLVQRADEHTVEHLAPQIDVGLCRADRQQLAAMMRARPDCLWWAERDRAGVTSIADARRRCEQLQAELAPDFDLAGYIG